MSDRAPNEPTYREIVARMPVDLAERRAADAALWDPTNQQYAALKAAAANSGAGAGEVHLHFHEAPPAPVAAENSDAGWLLLNRLIPYIIAAALVVFLVGGCLAILAYVFTFVMAMLMALIHSAVEMTATAVALVAAVAILAKLVQGPVVQVKGNNNRVETKAGKR